VFNLSAVLAASTSADCSLVVEFHEIHLTTDVGLFGFHVLRGSGCGAWLAVGEVVLLDDLTDVPSALVALLMDLSTGSVAGAVPSNRGGFNSICKVGARGSKFVELSLRRCF